MIPSRRWANRNSTLLWLPIVVACYVAAGKLGLSLASVNASASAVWPPTGIAIAALLLIGVRMWPAIFIGALLVNITTTSDLVSSSGIAVGNTLEAVVAAILVGRFAGGRGAFERPQRTVSFALLAAFASTTISATIGVVTLVLTGHATWAEFGPTWFTWWLGDAAGALIVTPVLVLWASVPSWRALLPGVAERLLLFAAAVVTGLFLFGGSSELSLRNYPVAFLAFPVLVWAAFRFGPREASSAVLILAAIANWGTLNGYGAFIAPSQNESLLLLQAFLGIASITSMMLGSAVVDHRRAEEARQASEHRLRVVAEKAARSREEFLAVATHELRTPLTSLTGYAQLGMQAAEQGKIERLLPLFERINRQAGRLAGLITQLLDASRLEEGALAVRPERNDVSVMVADVVEAARASAVMHRWDIRVEPALFANVDVARFEQVLVNLVDNAMKFSPLGGTITVVLRKVGEDIQFSVADQGVGIAPDRVVHIFDRFYRGHVEQGLGGLGLGLYIAQEIVRRHGLRIEVDSTVGEGSSFRITLPVAPALTPQMRVDHSVSVMDGTLNGVGQVLVVDDDADVRDLICTVLLDAGFEVVSAANGTEALAYVSRERPDLIVLDKLMPVMDGTAFMRAYREQGPTAPVIGLCAARDAAEWAASIKAVDYVAKPFDVTELRRVVLQHLPVRA